MKKMIALVLVPVLALSITSVAVVAGPINHLLTEIFTPFHNVDCTKQT